MIVTTLFLMYEKPARPGVYKLARIDGDTRIWCYWCGEAWWSTAWTPLDAEYHFIRNNEGLDAYNPRKVIGWRGLAEPA